MIIEWIKNALIDEKNGSGLHIEQYISNNILLKLRVFGSLKNATVVTLSATLFDFKTM